MKRWPLGVLGCALCLAALTTEACKDRALPTEDCEDREPAFGALTALADEYGTDKGTRGHHFASAYELYFQPIRHEARKVLEIGVLRGASLRMWREYFPNARIFGIDIEDTSSVDSDRISTFIADQSDRKQLQAFIDQAGGDFDVIVDDGGHSMEQQQVSLGYLLKHVRPGGYYVIEDVHTSIYAVYQDRFGATPTGENTTLAMIDNFVRTGNIESRYMAAKEKEDVTSNIVYANLVSQDKGRSIACIFKKLDPSEAARKRKSREKT
jgi:predicted O-methyltransferase YrrM